MLEEKSQQIKEKDNLIYQLKNGNMNADTDFS